MKKFNKLIVTVCIFIALLVSGIALVVFLLFLPADRSKEVIVMFDRCDEASGSGFFHKAEEILKKGAPLVESRRDFLRLLKRLKAIGKYTRNAELYNENVERAFVKFPGNEDLAFLKGLSLLDRKDFAGFRQWLDKTASMESLNLLRILYGVRNNDMERIRSFLKAGDTDYVEVLESENPDFFKEVGLRWGSRELLLNSALHYLAAGRSGEAYELFDSHLSGPEFDEPAAFAAFDYGRTDEALERLRRSLESNSQQPELQAFMGDLYFRLSLWDKARGSYLKAISINKKTSSSVYLNLNWIYRHNKMYDSAELILTEGLDVFPGDRSLLLELGRLYKTTGDREAIARTLEVYRRNNIDDPYLQLFDLLMNKESIPRKRFKLALWDLNNRFPKNRKICEIMTSYFLFTGEFREAETALKNFAAYTGKDDSWFLLHARGVLEVLRKNYDSGIELLDRSLSLKEDRFTRYNKGTALLEARRLKEAVSEFWLALELEEAKEEPVFQSNTAMNIGAALFEMGDTRGAREQLEYAVEINAENTKALMLLKKLEDQQ